MPPACTRTSQAISALHQGKPATSRLAALEKRNISQFSPPELNIVANFQFIQCDCSGQPKQSRAPPNQCPYTSLWQGKIFKLRLWSSILIPAVSQAFCFRRMLGHNRKEGGAYLFSFLSVGFRVTVPGNAPDRVLSPWTACRHVHGALLHLGASSNTMNLSWVCSRFDQDHCCPRRGGLASGHSSIGCALGKERAWAAESDKGKALIFPVRATIKSGGHLQLMCAACQSKCRHKWVAMFIAAGRE